MATRLPVQECAMTPELEKAMGEWHAAVIASKEAAARENETRMAVFAHFFPEGDPRRSAGGKDKFQMPGGFVLEIERRINVKIDKAALPAVRQVVSEMPVDPETGEVPTIEHAIRMAPEFSESGYKALPEHVRLIVNDCLTFTPGTPGLKLEPPKAAKPSAKAGHNPFA